MIKSTLTAMHRGSSVMLSNSKLLLVAVLIFLFPILFIWTTQSFFDTAFENINTVEKQQVSQLHDAIETVLLHSDSPEAIDLFIQRIATEQSSVSKLRIFKARTDGREILHAIDTELVGTVVPSDEADASTLTVPGGSVIVPFTANNERMWQVFRKVTLPSEEELFIFSEHGFGVSDSVILARQQNSYIVLSVIFIFLIALAYWVTRQKNWFRENQTLRSQLKDRDLFTNMLAHEFRAPLTAMRGYASMLQETELDKEQHRFATTITSSTERMIALVNDFLEVARVQTGKLSYSFEETDVVEVIKHVLAEELPTASKKGLSLVNETQAQKIMLHSDHKRLTQVLTNIVNNSIKYTGSGTIAVEATQKRNKTIIKIKDTGAGISAEDQQKLFAPFSRVGQADQGSETGSGLGMWITKQMVGQLGGMIAVESIEGIGTHIVITFIEK